MKKLIGLYALTMVAFYAAGSVLRKTLNYQDELIDKAFGLK